MTKITDPRSNSVTISYDSAHVWRAISLPESTTEDFTNDQEAGWTNSGTSGSPAPSTLLAVAGSTYTSPNGNTTTIQPDWMGMGLAGNIIDPLGNVQLFDQNSNGLPTVAVDQVNRNTQYGYDSKGNVTSIIYEDGNDESYTYNSDSRAAHLYQRRWQHDELYVQRREPHRRRGCADKPGDDDLHVNRPAPDRN